jgi:hypothetical protein
MWVVRSGSDFGGEETVTALTWSLHIGRWVNPTDRHFAITCRLFVTTLAELASGSVYGTQNPHVIFIKSQKAPFSFFGQCSSAGARSDGNSLSARLMRDAAHLVAEWESGCSRDAV